MLQVLAQLYDLTGENVYRDRAEAIANDFAGATANACWIFDVVQRHRNAARSRADCRDRRSGRRGYGGAEESDLRRQPAWPSVDCHCPRGCAASRASSFRQDVARRSRHGLCLPGTMCSLPIVEPDDSRRLCARRDALPTPSAAAYPRRHTVASQGCAPRGAPLGR